MSRDIDALASYTLKHLRDRWWTTRWTHWVSSHLRCDPGERLVHIGCGNGEIDVALALATPGLDVVSVDLHPTRARHTRELAAEVNARVLALAGDLRALPVAPGCADAVLCIGVLQHLPDPASAVGSLAALVRPGGRILVVEPDHEARYWFSASPAGERAFAAARDTLGRWHREGAPDAPSRLGVHVVSWLREANLEALSVELLPVSESRLGAPPPGVWEARERILTATAAAPGRGVDGERLLEALYAYRDEADAQGAAFVEVQHALLVATLAQRPPSPAFGVTLVHR
jgi:SAM-dependent methyltransferase